MVTNARIADLIREDARRGDPRRVAEGALLRHADLHAGADRARRSRARSTREIAANAAGELARLPRRRSSRRSSARTTRSRRPNEAAARPRRPPPRLRVTDRPAHEAPPPRAALTLASPCGYCRRRLGDYLAVVARAACSPRTAERSTAVRAGHLQGRLAAPAICRAPTRRTPPARCSCRRLDAPPATPQQRSYDELQALWQRAGAAYGIPWQVLAAINKVESNFGRNMGPSSAGAIGWMQFMPDTWLRWGIDANGDGIADPWNPDDAVYSAAALSRRGRRRRRTSRARVFAYNHADWYVDEVLGLATAVRRRRRRCLLARQLQVKLEAGAGGRRARRASARARASREQRSSSCASAALDDRAAACGPAALRPAGRRQRRPCEADQRERRSAAEVAAPAGAARAPRRRSARPEPAPTAASFDPRGVAGFWRGPSARRLRLPGRRRPGRRLRLATPTTTTRRWTSPRPRARRSTRSRTRSSTPGRRRPRDCGIGFTSAAPTARLDVLPPVRARPDRRRRAQRSPPASRSASSARRATRPARTSTSSSSRRPRGRSRSWFRALRGHRVHLAGRSDRAARGLPELAAVFAVAPIRSTFAGEGSSSDCSSAVAFCRLAEKGYLARGDSLRAPRSPSLAAALLATTRLTFARPRRSRAARRPACRRADAELVVPDIRRPGIRLREGHARGGRLRLEVEGRGSRLRREHRRRADARPGHEAGCQRGAPRSCSASRKTPGTPRRDARGQVSPTRVPPADSASHPATSRPRRKPKSLRRRRSNEDLAAAKKTKVAAKKPASTPHARLRRGRRARGAARRDDADARATKLDAWVAAHPKRTPADVDHWLYQHKWIVSGARFGWSHGAESLRMLVAVDERVQKLWGVGADSEAVARKALVDVKASAR